MDSNPSHGEVDFSGLFSSSFFFFPHHVTYLSHNACWPVNSGFTTLYGGGKKRKQRHLWRQNSEVSAMYGKGAKKLAIAGVRETFILVIALKP